MSPRPPPPYTRPMFSAANARPSVRAAASKAGSPPLAEPQYTHTFSSLPAFTDLSLLVFVAPRLCPMSTAPPARPDGGLYAPTDMEI